LLKKNIIGWILYNGKLVPHIIVIILIIIDDNLIIHIWIMLNCFFFWTNICHQHINNYMTYIYQWCLK
jgi:hypothetical protein